MKATPFTAYVKRWKDGEQLSVLATEAEAKRSKFRRTLIAAVGGKDAFRKLRAAGAGGTAAPFGGKRGTRAPAPVADDKKVKRIKATFQSSQEFLDGEPIGKPVTFWWIKKPKPNGHWRVERHYARKTVEIKDVGRSAWRVLKFNAYRSPKDRVYVEAKPNENCTLIVDTRGRMLGVLRLKRFEDSSTAKKVKQEKQEIERGEVALKRIRKAKRARRAERKARRKRS